MIWWKPPWTKWFDPKGLPRLINLVQCNTTGSNCFGPLDQRDFTILMETRFFSFGGKIHDFTVLVGKHNFKVLARKLDFTILRFWRETQFCNFVLLRNTQFCDFGGK